MYSMHGTTTKTDIRALASAMNIGDAFVTISQSTTKSNFESQPRALHLTDHPSAEGAGVGDVRRTSHSSPTWQIYPRKVIDRVQDRQ